MKLWLWQKLWKPIGSGVVFYEFAEKEDNEGFSATPGEGHYASGWQWLCPKPNLVLVDPKYTPFHVYGVPPSIVTKEYELY
jgi:hypothetical protein